MQNSSAYVHEKINDENLPAYNTACKVIPLSWAQVGRKSWLPVPVQMVCTGTDLQPTREALDYDSNHVLAPQLARAMPGGLLNWPLKATNVPSNTAEMHITQAVSYIGIRLQISVYHKWALRLKKKIILYSQKCHRTKFLSSREWRNRSLFQPWYSFLSPYITYVHDVHYNIPQH